jgi:hypothetical protein
MRRDREALAVFAVGVGLIGNALQRLKELDPGKSRAGSGGKDRAWCGAAFDEPLGYQADPCNFIR